MGMRMCVVDLWAIWNHQSSPKMSDTALSATTDADAADLVGTETSRFRNRLKSLHSDSMATIKKPFSRSYSRKMAIRVHEISIPLQSREPLRRNTLYDSWCPSKDIVDEADSNF